MAVAASAHEVVGKHNCDILEPSQLLGSTNKQSSHRLLSHPPPAGICTDAGGAQYIAEDAGCFQDSFHELEHQQNAVKRAWAVISSWKG